MRHSLLQALHQRSDLASEDANGLIKQPAVFFWRNQIDTRRWTATNLVLDARACLDKLRIPLKWQKVAAHTSDLMNQRADALAKAGALSTDGTDVNSVIPTHTIPGGMQQ